jgi:hypothetical protein
VTRDTKVRLAIGAAVFAVAAVCMFWLTGRSQPAKKDTPSQANAAPPAAEPPAPIDPHVLAEVGHAYRKSLAESAPPGMLDLMQGKGQPGADELPPLPDPFVTRARFDPDPVGDLPPLPPDLTSRPELLPPPDVSPAAGKDKEEPASDLPPLPPTKKP